jgi:hypothetical protein
MKAQLVQEGDYIVGFGLVTEVHRYDNDVASRQSVMTKKPDLQGALLGARLVAESQEHAYDNQPASITFRSATGKQLSRRPNEEVQVYTVEVPNEMAEAA